MKKLSLSLFSLFLLLPSLTLADTLPASSVPGIALPSLFTSSSSKKPSIFKVKGYLDASYNYLSRNDTFTSGVNDRVYDLTLNGFTLQQGSLALSYLPPQGLGGLINPVVGRDTYSAAPYGWNPYYGSEWVGFFIPQAYLQYARGALTLIGGSFYTLAGYESFDPTTDTNFSRSILWGYAEPTTHIGFRGTYTINDKLVVIAGINNGWDNIRDTGRRKTLELSATYTPNSHYSLEVTGYSGGQRATDRTDTGPQSIRNLLDVIATFNISDKLTLIANYDYGIQSQATLPGGTVDEAVFTGVAGYLNYKFNDSWRTSIRGEVFDDRNGYRTGVAQCWKEATITLGYVPLRHLELRAETRRDFSNVSSFVTTGRNGVSNNNQSFALEGVYQFG